MCYLTPGPSDLKWQCSSMCYLTPGPSDLKWQCISMCHLTLGPSDLKWQCISICHLTPGPCDLKWQCISMCHLTPGPSATFPIWFSFLYSFFLSLTIFQVSAGHTVIFVISYKYLLYWPTSLQSSIVYLSLQYLQP